MIEQLQLRWLRYNLPVISQPTIDIQCGNALNCIFYEFNDDNTQCTIYIVYDSEASYNRYSDTSDPGYNTLGTFCYRSYNQHKYKRTADINTLYYSNVNLVKCTYDSIYTTDYAHTQCFNKLDKRNILWWSFCYHYTLQCNTTQYERYNNNCNIGYRAVLYNNTCNHMIGYKNNNTTLPQTLHTHYTVYQGTRVDTERYCEQYIQPKWTVQRCCNPFKWMSRSAKIGKISVIDWNDVYNVVTDNKCS